MKNQFLKITTLSLIASSVIYAGGYDIPEASSNSIALSGANIAHAKDADVAFDNPANMMFMDNANHIEVNFMYVGTSATNFQGTAQGIPAPSDGIDAQKQTAFVPSLFYVSPKLGDTGIKVGFAMFVPGGLTREWTEQPAQSTAEKFSLTVIELNPTLAYSITDTVSIAGGVRMLYSSGEVVSSSAASRNMEGNSVDFGYNLALSYKPTDSIDLALSYRSNVDLTTEGNAKLYIGDAKVYDGGVSLTAPIPAALNVAMAYTFPTKTTLEFVYERTFWSAYESIDFNYKSNIPAILQPSFDNPVARDWVDTSAFRLGLTQELETMTLMAGFVIDETPTPEATLGFESPGNDSMAFSFGGRYEISESMDIGLAALYTMKEDRVVTNASIDGEFTNSNALLISAGLGYKF